MHAEQWLNFQLAAAIPTYSKWARVCQSHAIVNHNLLLFS